MNQKINRRIRTADEIDALKNPLKKTEIKFDNFGRPSQKIIGEKASVILNPNSGRIVTTHQTSSKLAIRLKKELKGY